MKSEYEKLLEWCCGDQEAATCAAIMGRISQVADDFADGDVAPDEGSAKMLQLLHMSMVELPENRFYQRYQAYFLPILSSSLLIWDATNDWAVSPSKTSRYFAYAYREILDQVLILAARLTGGTEHARAVARDVHLYYHIEQGEPFEDWIKEVDDGQQPG